MLMGDFRTDLRIAENYQNEVDRVLKSLQSELRNYLIKEGLLVVAASAAIGAATGGAGGAGEYILSQLVFITFRWIRTVVSLPTSL